VTAEELLMPVLGAMVPFFCFMAVGLLGLSLLHMIGKTN
jgi:hypothetical protein